LSGTAGLCTAHDSHTLGTSADEYVTISNFEYDSLIQKIHPVSTLDIAILAHLGISYLASSSPSFWIIDSGASIHMTSKSIVFLTFHTFSIPSIVFAYGSFKHSAGNGTVNLTSSLALTDVNYI